MDTLYVYYSGHLFSVEYSIERGEYLAQLIKSKPGDVPARFSPLFKRLSEEQQEAIKDAHREAACEELQKC